MVYHCPLHMNQIYLVEMIKLEGNCATSTSTSEGYDWSFGFPLQVNIDWHSPLPLHALRSLLQSKKRPVS